MTTDGKRMTPMSTEVALAILSFPAFYTCGVTVDSLVYIGYKALTIASKLVYTSEVVIVIMITVDFSSSSSFSDDF